MSDSSFFGLSQSVKNYLFESKNISCLYQWQDDCIREIERIAPKNFLYMAPTSGGKTLVAEILSIKELLLNQKNVLFILPFVSIVYEKVQAFSSLALKLGYLVEEYAGSKGKIPPIKRIKRRSIFVCTIEKSLVIINSLIEENRLSELGLVVVDELHLIGEKSRGPILENALLKIILANIRIIGMSATIGNPKSLGKFLNGIIYSASFRPNALKEHVVVKDEVFTINYTKQASIQLKEKVNTSTVCRLNGKCLDYPDLAYLLVNFIPDQSCLIFCQTKKTCESICQIVCSIISQTGVEYQHIKTLRKLELIRSLKEECNGRIDNILKLSIKYGVAYHHSGLTIAERKLLEEYFADGTLCCLCCTSTLAAGVNLPAQRVIIRAPLVGKDFITYTQYKQMAGRAGRTGFGHSGDVYTLCSCELAPKFWQMITGNVASIQSQSSVQNLAELILSLMHLKLAKDNDSIRAMIKKTFLYTTLDDADVAITEMFNSALTLLSPFYDIDNVNSSVLHLSTSGQAVANGNIPLHHVRDLEADLEHALEHFVLLSDLHALYLITPANMCDELNLKYDVMSSIFTKIKKNDMITANALGITEHCIQRMMCGLPLKNLPKRVLSKFLVAFILQLLLDGESIWSISEVYGFERGFVNNLIQSSASSCSSVIRFCQVLKKYDKIRLILEPLPEKIGLSHSGDLIPLMQLPAVRKGRAKQLFDAGFKTVADIAKSDQRILADKIPHLRLKQAKEMICVAKMIVLGESEALREEAEALMEAVHCHNEGISSELNLI